MDDKYGTLLIGGIILVLISNTIAIWSMASIVYGQDYMQKSFSSLNNSTAIISTENKTPAMQVTTITPGVTNIPEPIKTITIPAPEKSETPSIISIETPKIVQTPITVDIYESSATKSSTANPDYITIYSIENQIINNLSPDVSVNLKNPPLILDFTVMPLNITEIEFEEYKVIDTMHYENVTIDRPYEGCWFEVTVTDKNTGKTVLEKGYGRQYGLIPTQHLQVLESGNYFFDFSGQFTRVTLTMKVPRQGNFE